MARAAGGGEAAPEKYTGPTRTSGWAIAGLVACFLLPPVLPVILGMIAKDQIRKANGRLTGDGMANVSIVLGSIFTVAAVVVYLGLTSNSDNAGGFKGPEKQVAAVVDRFETGLDDNEGGKVCDELLTLEFAKKVAKGSGQTCPDAVMDAVDSGQYQARIDVKSISITGDTATVKVREGGDKETWTLRRESGSWRVDAIVVAPK